MVKNRHHTIFYFGRMTQEELQRINKKLEIMKSCNMKNINPIKKLYKLLYPLMNEKNAEIVECCRIKSFRPRRY
ncbi:hypothetical protein MSIBF_A1970009 [groundwater metagenome]|uniref:Uncharacterized protein n=1 Tax=groundwater metagenome TaxID=717931 RepID=A0A098E7Z1_9ZZZZ